MLKTSQKQQFVQRLQNMYFFIIWLHNINMFQKNTLLIKKYQKQDFKINAKYSKKGIDKTIGFWYYITC